MPKAERRRWIKLNLSQDHDTPESVLRKNKNKKKIKHGRSVSSEGADNMVPFPSVRRLLEEDQPLLSRQNSYYDDHDTDNDSADWEWEESMADGVAEATSTTSLFGAGQWSSTWPSKAVMEIMDAVNVQLEGLEATTGNTDHDQLPGFLSAYDQSLKITVPNEPRNILPEHEKLAINAARNTLGATPQCTAHVLSSALRYAGECGLSPSTEPATLSAPLLPAGSPTFSNPTPTFRPAHHVGDITSRPDNNRALEFDKPDNTDFNGLEISLRAWHEQIEAIQVELFSIGNMRDTLVDGGRMLLALRAKVDHDHQNWQPQAIPIESVRAQTATHYVVETTFNEESKLHELPKVTKVSMARDGRVLRQVEKQNADYKKFEKDFNKVMMPLRYVQVQFKNLQIKLEHALAVEVLLLRQAIGLHEDLETQLGESTFGGEPSRIPQALSGRSLKSLQKMECSSYDKQVRGSAHSTEYESTLPALSRSSRSSSFDSASFYSSKRQSLESTMTSVDEGVSDFPTMMRQRCSVITEVAAEVIENMTEGIEGETRGIARAHTTPGERSNLSNSKRLHSCRCVEFGNVRKINGDIMLSMPESADVRAGLGRLVR